MKCVKATNKAGHGNDLFTIGRSCDKRQWINALCPCIVQPNDSIIQLQVVTLVLYPLFHASLDNITTVNPITIHGHSSAIWGLQFIAWINQVMLLQMSFVAKVEHLKMCLIPEVWMVSSSEQGKACWYMISVIWVYSLGGYQVWGWGHIHWYIFSPALRVHGQVNEWMDQLEHLTLTSELMGFGIKRCVIGEIINQKMPFKMDFNRHWAQKKCQVTLKVYKKRCSNWIVSPL